LTEDAPTSAGLRLEFWKKSIMFIGEAPIVGHGTGSISELFRLAASKNGGASADVAHNPHQQIFAVAIQLGFIGSAILIAMWIAHLMLFNGAGLVPCIGMAIVVQNAVSSMFNSHLFDFTRGWIYVLGVGTFGRIIGRRRRSAGNEAEA
jgi:O-antigen ligase